MNYQEALQACKEAENAYDASVKRIEEHRNTHPSWSDVSTHRVRQINTLDILRMRDSGEVAFVITSDEFFTPIQVKVVKVNVKSFRLMEVGGERTFTVYIDELNNVVSVEKDPYTGKQAVDLYDVKVLEAVEARSNLLVKKKELEIEQAKIRGEVRAARIQKHVEWIRENRPEVFAAEAVAASSDITLFSLLIETKAKNSALACVAIKEVESYVEDEKKLWYAQVGSVTTGRFGGGSGTYRDEQNLTMHEFLAWIMYDIYED